MKIAIAGYGTEGKASYRYWNTPKHQVVVVDEQEIDVPVGASSITGEGVFGRLNGFDMVIRSPGLVPRKIITDGKIWSATNEFFAKCPALIIGVTGTKGKGTTSSLIASILRAAGKTVHLVGNIGQPALDVLPDIQPDDIVVYELSSFQLWDLEKSPQVAVVLMIEPDHLDVHADFTEYVAAKANIAANQLTTDRVVYYAGDEWSTQIAETSPGQRLPYPTERTAHVRGEYFYYGDTEVCATENVGLPGVHNLENACAAITATRPWVQDGVVIAEGLHSFDGLPHRLKFVREVNGVRYYDDSIATTPGSAIAAIKAFQGQPLQRCHWCGLYLQLYEQLLQQLEQQQHLCQQQDV
jgi:UDP-N-acetylmuramoylalanine--D-glutamate ligase